MNDYRLQLMTGADVPVPELSLIIHAPTLKEIAMMGERQFFQAVQYLCLKKEALVQDKTLLSSLTNFQVLMKVLQQSEDKEKKVAVITLLRFMFPRYNVIMTKNSIILTLADGESVTPLLIDDSNFEAFQKVIGQIFCVNNIFQGDNIIYNPANAEAERIANKLMKARAKVAQQKEDKGESILTRYISILTIAQVISLRECYDINLFQLFDLVERYNKYLEWDIDLRVRLAGGTSNEQVGSWMEDLYTKN